MERRSFWLSWIILRKCWKTSLCRIRVGLCRGSRGARCISQRRWVGLSWTRPKIWIDMKKWIRLITKDRKQSKTRTLRNQYKESQIRKRGSTLCNKGQTWLGTSRSKSIWRRSPKLGITTGLSLIIRIILHRREVLRVSIKIWLLIKWEIKICLFLRKLYRGIRWMRGLGRRGCSEIRLWKLSIQILICMRILTNTSSTRNL